MAGPRLATIRDDRLYRATHDTFEDYCHERWGFTRQRASQLIQAATVSTVVDITNEAQARELVPLLGSTDDLIETVRELKSEYGDSLTAETIRRRVKDGHEREQREEERLANRPAPEPVAPPTGTYSVILADPPWAHDMIPDPSRRTENKYPTMPLADICALPISAAPDCVLFLWATAPLIRQALLVMEAWGFEYRTQAVWVKDRIGMGFYWRGQHELLLLGLRGSPGTPLAADRPSSIIEAPRGEHSAKPEAAREQIERMYPNHSRIELFARTARDGWDVWGNQAPVAA